MSIFKKWRLRRWRSRARAVVTSAEWALAEGEEPGQVRTRYIVRRGPWWGATFPFKGQVPPYASRNANGHLAATMMVQTQIREEPKSTHQWTYRPSYAYIDDIQKPMKDYGPPYAPDWVFRVPVFTGSGTRTYVMSRLETPA